MALAAALLFSATAVFAAPADEARALMAQGQYAQALQKLDQHLAKNPQDAEARFSRGIALTKLNRTGDAMKVFTDLTRDYPQLPEPYNNLAVLYAQQGDYEKARDALEAALATHPSYATAHENLGDIYAALAGASYNRALKLDPSNTAVRGKLGLISQVQSQGGATQAPVKTETAPAAAPAAKAAAPALAGNSVLPAATASKPADSSGTSVDAATSAAVASLLSSWSQAGSSKNA
ncbi:MAG: tetratricopeptide repeat protein, partial [Rhizobium sp.]